MAACWACRRATRPTSRPSRSSRTRSKQQLRYFIRHIAIANLVAQKGHAIFLPKPLASALVEGCVESGHRHHATAVPSTTPGPAFIGTGVADLADSLAAFKKLVYEEGAVSMAELDRGTEERLQLGDRTARQMLINRAPKYGNDVAGGRRAGDRVHGLRRRRGRVVPRTTRLRDDQRSLSGILARAARQGGWRRSHRGGTHGRLSPTAARRSTATTSTVPLLPSSRWRRSTMTATPRARSST